MPNKDQLFLSFFASFGLTLASGMDQTAVKTKLNAVLKCQEENSRAPMIQLLRLAYLRI